MGGGSIIKAYIVIAAIIATIIAEITAAILTFFICLRFSFFAIISLIMHTSITINEMGAIKKYNISGMPIVTTVANIMYHPQNYFNQHLITNNKKIIGY
ncbi:MAG: hypothetical protein K2H90_04085 [Oscillospiraceae bacterium]|nr:hypothetical protein [Oscillospiraceae bacterium]